jgi:hypothetical protein
MAAAVNVAASGAGPYPDVELVAPTPQGAAPGLETLAEQQPDADRIFGPSLIQSYWGTEAGAEGLEDDEAAPGTATRVASSPALAADLTSAVREALLLEADDSSQRAPLDSVAPGNVAAGQRSPAVPAAAADAAAAEGLAGAQQSNKKQKKASWLSKLLGGKREKAKTGSCMQPQVEQEDTRADQQGSSGGGLFSSRRSKRASQMASDDAAEEWPSMNGAAASGGRQGDAGACDQGAAAGGSSSSGGGSKPHRLLPHSSGAPAARARVGV